MALQLKANRAKLIVDAALVVKYAIFDVCCFTLEGILATVRAAVAKRSPALIQLFAWAVAYIDGLLLHAAARLPTKPVSPPAHTWAMHSLQRASDILPI